MKRVRVIDSHTGGEPTRVVVEGGPDLGDGPISDRLKRFRDGHDSFRSGVINEPRGSDVMVGALLLKPSDPDCEAGVIFFNNVGCIGMCGHGAIGVVTTLAFLGRLRTGECRLETPVGPVSASLHDDGRVSVANVASWRKAKNVAIDLPSLGPLTGDIAWGGNWFFLIERHPWPLDLRDVETLTQVTWDIRQRLNAGGFPEVDHIELFGPPRHGGNSRNFVLCPGKAYDRSPCGTGTSAKLACLAADGKLQENAPWVQESIIGSTFTASYRWSNRNRGEILPVITGTAHVMSEASLLFDESDPFRWGIRGGLSPED